MQDHGVFSLYEPQGRASSAAYLQNAEGVDFYALCQVLDEAEGAFALLDPQTDRVVGTSARADRLFPLNLRLVFVPHADPGALSGLMVQDGAFVPAPPPLAPCVTRGQWARELAARARLSPEEAVRLIAQGEMPQALADHLAGLTGDDRIRLRAACAAERLERADPRLRAALSALGEDPDAVFTAAALREP